MVSRASGTGVQAAEAMDAAQGKDRRWEMQMRARLTADVLVLQIDGGKDTFITVRATFAPTIVGLPLEILPELPDVIRNVPLAVRKALRDLTEEAEGEGGEGEGGDGEGEGEGDGDGEEVAVTVGKDELEIVDMEPVTPVSPTASSWTVARGEEEPGVGEAGDGGDGEDGDKAGKGEGTNGTRAESEAAKVSVEEAKEEPEDTKEEAEGAKDGGDADEPESKDAGDEAESSGVPEATNDDDETKVEAKDDSSTEPAANDEAKDGKDEAKDSHAPKPSQKKREAVDLADETAKLSLDARRDDADPSPSVSPSDPATPAKTAPSISITTATPAPETPVQSSTSTPIAAAASPTTGRKKKSKAKTKGKRSAITKPPREIWRLLERLMELGPTEELWTGEVDIPATLDVIDVSTAQASKLGLQRSVGKPATAVTLACLIWLHDLRSTASLRLTYPRAFSYPAPPTRRSASHY